MNTTASQSWYAINAKADAAEVEVSIYDSIGAWGISAAQFVRELKAVKAKTINLRLNTPGGEVFDASAIYNALREHPARVIAHVDGLAASAGSFIAMSAAEVRMASNAYMMIHNAQGGVMGEAADMRQYADVLDKMNANIADMYALKTGRPAEHWRGLMDAETWFTAEEAVEQGLADTITGGANATAKASFDLKIYNKVPDAVLAAWGTQQQTNAPEVSPRGDAAPAVQTQEVSPMAETTTTAPPAQVPAPVIQSDKGLTPGEQQLANLRLATEARSLETAKAKGFTEGDSAAVARLRAIAANCPGDPQMAVNAFLGGQTPDAVKLAYDAAQAIRVAAAEREQTAHLEIERLKAQLAIGGHPGLNMGLDSLSDETIDTIDPKVRAENEWDQKPAVRKGFTNRERYVAARTAELKGQFRQHTASAR